MTISVNALELKNKISHLQKLSKNNYGVLNFSVEGTKLVIRKNLEENLQFSCYLDLKDFEENSSINFYVQASAICELLSLYSFQDGENIFISLFDNGKNIYVQMNSVSLPITIFSGIEISRLKDVKFLNLESKVEGCYKSNYKLLNSEIKNLLEFIGEPNRYLDNISFKYTSMGICGVTTNGMVLFLSEITTSDENSQIVEGNIIVDAVSLKSSITLFKGEGELTLKVYIDYLVVESQNFSLSVLCKSVKFPDYRKLINTSGYTSIHLTSDRLILPLKKSASNELFIEIKDCTISFYTQDKSGNKELWSGKYPQLADICFKMKFNLLLFLSVLSCFKNRINILVKDSKSAVHVIDETKYALVMPILEN